MLTKLQSLNIQDIIASIVYRVAQSRQELQMAFGLVYKEYIKRGYMSENQSGLRLSPFNISPESTTFVSKIQDEVIATATVIPDSPLGLPMDDIYAEELNSLRKDSKRICEISMLASDTDIFGSQVSLMLNSKKMLLIFYLFKRIFDYTQTQMNYDYLCITINPKHKLTYDFLMFNDLGGLKAYPKVNEAPAIAKYLDLRTAQALCEANQKVGLYKMFFFKRSAPENFSGKYKMTPEDLRYFFVEKSDVLASLSPARIDYIKSLYPEYDFSQILTH
jgi:hypothetical protein